VVTKQATFALLQQTSKAAQKLEESGKFKKKEFDLISNEIFRCRKQLIYKPPDIASQVRVPAADLIKFGMIPLCHDTSLL
jgi:hypothetical protein